jgi:O-antigen ligase
MLEDDRLLPAYVQVIAATLGVGLLIGSTVIGWSSVDVFRGPKEIAFRTEAILLAVILVFAATAVGTGWRALIDGLRPVEVLLPLAIVGWTVMTAAVSTNRPLSEESLVTVMAAVVIFLATRRVAPHLPLLALDLCLGIASINAVFVAVQEYLGWNPFYFPPEARGHITSTALVGNPNDVGSYLAAPLIAAIVAVVAVRGWRRLSYAVFTIVLAVGLVASGTRTAMLAVVCGAVVLALIRPLRQALVVLLIMVISLIVVLRPSTGLGQRAQTLVAAAQARKYDVLFSERLPPFLTAIDMLRSRPLWGVGPGTFKLHFMDTRMALEGRYPPAWTKGYRENFGETHNDHLQTAAESGLPGYALFLAAVAVVGLTGRRETPAAGDSRVRVGRALRGPLATTFFVLALGQFPLQIAAPRLIFMTLAALALGWDGQRG